MANCENSARYVMEEDFEVMLAKPFDARWITSFPVAVEPKLDGVRVLIVTRGDDCFFVSRNGLAFPSLDHFAPDVLRMLRGAGMRDVTLDAEVTVGDFNATVSAVRKLDAQATRAVFHVFDIVPTAYIDGDLTPFDYPYDLRRRELLHLTRHAPDFVKVVDCLIAKSITDITAAYRFFRSQGFEGAMVKNMDGPYVLGRSTAWMKMKDAETFDLIVTGVFEGKGKYAGSLGGLVCELDGVTVEVGTGFTDVERARIWERPSVAIGRYVEVTAQAKTPSGSLRHPRFFRWRDDKSN